MAVIYRPVFTFCTHSSFTHKSQDKHSAPWFKKLQSFLFRVIYQLRSESLTSQSAQQHVSVMNTEGWMDAPALVYNFLSSLKSSFVYLFNIHLERVVIKQHSSKLFKNKDAVRSGKYERLTERSAFRLMWKYLRCLLPGYLIPAHLTPYSSNTFGCQWCGLLSANCITSCYRNPQR